MKTAIRSLIPAVICCLVCGAASPQSKPPAETRNAALRYWMAFAELEDPPADKQTQDLLERTASGEVPFDEARLGPILDKNEDAIQMMQRATKLPECDWGLEYRLGPRASIAYVPRARVLARLNTLYGMSLAAKGDSQGALNTWLAGLRFAQHLSDGGSLIFLLVAKATLLSNLRAIAKAAQSGQLSNEQRITASSAVRALPETAFDWAGALRLEESALEIGADQLRNASNPAEYYQQLTGKPAPSGFALPATENVAFHAAMASAVQAMKLPPTEAAPRLQHLQESTQSLNPYFRETIPSFVRINEARAQISAARQDALSALAAR